MRTETTSKHPVADVEFGHVPADGFNGTCNIDSHDLLPGSAPSVGRPNGKETHAVIDIKRVDGGAVHFDQHSIFVTFRLDHGLGDFFNL
jgi:hypothetical protein